MSEKCTAKVYGRDRFASFHPYPCSRKGKVQREGKWYCAIHDPEAVKTRDAERRNKWNADWKKKEEAWEREAILRELSEGIPTAELRQYQLVRQEKGH